MKQRTGHVVAFVPKSETLMARVIQDALPPTLLHTAFVGHLDSMASTLEAIRLRNKLRLSVAEGEERILEIEHTQRVLAETILSSTPAHWQRVPEYYRAILVRLYVLTFAEQRKTARGRRERRHGSRPLVHLCGSPRDWTREVVANFTKTPDLKQLLPEERARFRTQLIDFGKAMEGYVITQGHHDFRQLGNYVRDANCISTVKGCHATIAASGESEWRDIPAYYWAVCRRLLHLARASRRQG